MRPIAERLLDDALGLSVAERAKLARELLASMDGEPDADGEAAWAEEIVRREAPVASGESRPVDWASVRQDAASRLRVR